MVLKHSSHAPPHPLIQGGFSSWRLSRLSSCCDPRGIFISRIILKKISVWIRYQDVPWRQLHRCLLQFSRSCGNPPIGDLFGLKPSFLWKWNFSETQYGIVWEVYVFWFTGSGCIICWHLKSVDEKAYYFQEEVSSMRTWQNELKSNEVWLFDRPIYDFK